MIPGCWRNEAVVAIKGLHTAILVSVFAAVVLTLWDGLRGSPGKRTAITGGMVLAESALYVSNNQVCPLTPLAEEFGAERGSVVDMFLPAAVARQIPLVAGSAAVLSTCDRTPRPSCLPTVWASNGRDREDQAELAVRVGCQTGMKRPI